MLEDWSEKWYKLAYSRSSAEKPKAEVWSQIEAYLEGWFRRWYKRKAQGNPRASKAQVWDAISAFVDQELLLRRQARLRVVRSSVVLLIFAAIPMLLEDSFSGRLTNVGAALTTPTSSSDKASFSANTGTQHQILATNEQQNVDVEMNQLDPYISTPAEYPGTLSLASTEDVSELSGLKTQMAQTLEHPPVELQTSTDRPRLSKPVAGKWSIATAAVYQHSNLYNETTRMGFARTSHISNESKPNFSMDFALIRQLNPRSSLSFDVRVNDVKGQRYMDFENAQYLSKELVSTYQSFSVNYHRLLRSDAGQHWFNLEASLGLFGSYRSNIRETVGGEDREFLSPGIRKFDTGIQFGIHSIFHVSNPISLTLNTYYTNGLINAFKGVDKVPARFYTSYTASYGLSIGLRYHLHL